MCRLLTILWFKAGVKLANIRIEFQANASTMWEWVLGHPTGGEQIDQFLLLSLHRRPAQTNPTHVSICSLTFLVSLFIYQNNFRIYSQSRKRIPTFQILFPQLSVWFAICHVCDVQVLAERHMLHFYVIMSHYVIMLLCCIIATNLVLFWSSSWCDRCAPFSQRDCLAIIANISWSYSSTPFPHLSVQRWKRTCVFLLGRSHHLCQVLAITITIATITIIIYAQCQPASAPILFKPALKRF